MIRTLIALLGLAGLAPAGLAPPEFMLCFHRDGRVRVENYRELCCTSACPEGCDRCPPGTGGDDRTGTECPDDQCQDFPLTVTSPQSAFDAPPPAAVEAPGVPIPDAAWIFFPPLPSHDETRFHSDFLGPPINRPGTLPSSAVLRL